MSSSDSPLDEGRRARGKAKSKQGQEDETPCEDRPYFLGKPRYSSSVAIGVAMLQCFDNGPQALGITDMADMLAVGRSSTHRYAMTLLRFGWLEQDRERKYRLAFRSTWPGMTILHEIASTVECDPVLRELREQSGHTASLGVFDQTHVR